MGCQQVAKFGSDVLIWILAVLILYSPAVAESARCGIKAANPVAGLSIVSHIRVPKIDDKKQCLSSRIDCLNLTGTEFTPASIFNAFLRPGWIKGVLGVGALVAVHGVQGNPPPVHLPSFSQFEMRQSGKVPSRRLTSVHESNYEFRLTSYTLDRACPGVLHNGGSPPKFYFRGSKIGGFANVECFFSDCCALFGSYHRPSVLSDNLSSYFKAVLHRFPLLVHQVTLAPIDVSLNNDGQEYGEVQSATYYEGRARRDFNKGRAGIPNSGPAANSEEEQQADNRGPTPQTVNANCCSPGLDRFNVAVGFGYFLDLFFVWLSRH